MNTATEAREKTCKTIENRFNTEKKVIQQDIDKAVKNGLFSVTTCVNASPKICEWLTSLGYRVETNSATGMSIYW